MIKLRLPELDQASTEELCNLLKFIDNISFKHFDVSCYELVLGATFNESVILATEPPYKKPKLELELEEEIKRSKTEAHLITTTAQTVTKVKQAKSKQNGENFLKYTKSNSNLIII